MSDTEVHGPIDYLVVEFPDGSATEGPARALADLVDRGIVRLYDLALVTRTPSGDVVAVEMDAGVDDGGCFSSFAGARSGLLDGDDLVEAADLLTPGSTGLVVVFENAWAASFVAESRNAGGEMVASARITAQALLDVLDALDAVEPVS